MSMRGLLRIVARQGPLKMLASRSPWSGGRCEWLHSTHHPCPLHPPELFRVPEDPRAVLQTKKKATMIAEEVLLRDRVEFIIGTVAWRIFLDFAALLFPSRSRNHCSARLLGT